MVATDRSAHAQMDQIGAGEGSTHLKVWWDMRKKQIRKVVQDHGGRIPARQVEASLLKAIAQGEVSDLAFDTHAGIVYYVYPQKRTATGAAPPPPQNPSQTMNHPAPVFAGALPLGEQNRYPPHRGGGGGGGFGMNTHQQAFPNRVPTPQMDQRDPRTMFSQDGLFNEGGGNVAGGRAVGGGTGRGDGYLFHETLAAPTPAPVSTATTTAAAAAAVGRGAGDSVMGRDIPPPTLRAPRGTDPSSVPFIPSSAADSSRAVIPGERFAPQDAPQKHQGGAAPKQQQPIGTRGRGDAGSRQPHVGRQATATRHTEECSSPARLDPAAGKHVARVRGSRVSTQLQPGMRTSNPAAPAPARASIAQQRGTPAVAAPVDRPSASNSATAVVPSAATAVAKNARGDLGTGVVARSATYESAKRVEKTTAIATATDKQGDEKEQAPAPAPAFASALEEAAAPASSVSPRQELFQSVKAALDADAATNPAAVAAASAPLQSNPPETSQLFQAVSAAVLAARNDTTVTLPGASTMANAPHVAVKKDPVPRRAARAPTAIETAVRAAAQAKARAEAKTKAKAKAKTEIKAKTKMETKAKAKTEAEAEGTPARAGPIGLDSGVDAAGGVVRETSRGCDDGGTVGDGVDNSSATKGAARRSTIVPRAARKPKFAPSSAKKQDEGAKNFVLVDDSASLAKAVLEVEEYKRGADADAVAGARVVAGADVAAVGEKKGALNGALQGIGPVAVRVEGRRLGDPLGMVSTIQVTLKW